MSNELLQRRRFFRVDVQISMRWWRLDPEETPPAEAASRKVNISGCGIRFEGAGDIATDALVGLELILPPPGGSVEVVGRVVRITEGERGREAALDFVNIDAGLQERIIRFCLAEQRSQLREKVRVKDLK